MPGLHQTHPDQFEFQHGLLDQHFGQNTIFFFISRYSSSWANSVCSSRKVLEGIRRDSIRWKGRFLTPVSYGHQSSYRSLYFAQVCHDDRIKFTISFCFWDDNSKKTSFTYRFVVVDSLFTLATMFIYFLPS